jgi:hypothetical protein
MTKGQMPQKMKQGNLSCRMVGSLVPCRQIWKVETCVEIATGRNKRTTPNNGSTRSDRRGLISKRVTIDACIPVTRRWFKHDEEAGKLGTSDNKQKLLDI